jgi:rRNA-processing protein FCF1
LGTIVLDANICVDLSNGNLLEAVLRLPNTFQLPDVIIEELKDPDGTALISSGYQPRRLSPEEVQIAIHYASKYAKPSRTDLFALVAAKTSNSILLTGDENLRKAGMQEGVEVHGLFWLMDKLFESKIVSGPDLAIALGSIIEKGARLPRNEIQRRRDKWK